MITGISILNNAMLLSFYAKEAKALHFFLKHEIMQGSNGKNSIRIHNYF